MVFNAEKAAALQKLLAEKALRETLEATPLEPGSVRYIAGFDSAYKGETQYAVMVVYDILSRTVVQRVFEAVDVKAPYIPGLLAFREVPGYVRAYKKTTVEPNILIVDGHGLAHPRAFGIATHLGLVLGKPSIGVAKSKLYGDIVEQDGRRVIRAHGLVVGEVLEHENTKLYVSIGYKIRLEDAVNTVKSLLEKGRRLPIPLDEADKYSKQVKHKH